MISRLSAVSGRDVSRETMDRLELFAGLLRGESERQNLVASSTVDSLWERHIVDAAQLVKYAPSADASWVDIGSGAGLPGLVVALLTDGPITLVEPRRLRADFLLRAVATLDLEERVTIASAKAESVVGTFDVIAARAVARLDKLMGISTHLSTRNSVWLLPKGRSAQSELAEARRRWHCDAEAVPSVTDPQSEILVLRNVRKRGGR